MQGQLGHALDADAWTRTSLAGQLARLCEPDVKDVAALIASGRLHELVAEAELAPRRWARALGVIARRAHRLSQKDLLADCRPARQLIGSLPLLPAPLCCGSIL